MFDTGGGFHEAAMRCAEPVGLSEGYSAPTPPMITCFALAAELYLKALLLAGGREPPKQHRLNVLLAMLAPTVQADIMRHLRTLTGESDAELEKGIQQLGAAFVEWRYIFESEGRDIAVGLLVELARSLYEVIRTRQPGWAVDDYSDRRVREDSNNYPLHVICGRGGVVSVIHRASIPSSKPQ